MASTDLAPRQQTLPAEAPEPGGALVPMDWTPTAEDELEPYLKERDGELRPLEALYRLALLAGAGLFLGEAMGAPWHHGWLIASAAAVPAILVVATMTLQWRVLGDWRRMTQRLVLVAAMAALVVPFCGVMDPSLGATALPNALEQPLAQALAAARRVPLLGIGVSTLSALATSALYLVVVGALVFGRGAGRRAAFLLLGTAVAAASLFFYPTPETALGLALLAIFFHVQWERPLLVPDRLRPRLSPQQIGFLKELVKEGTLSPGEVKLYLNHDAAAFAELAECGLVDYDRLLREVRPGRRLDNDPATEVFDSTLTIVRRGVWVVLGLVYVVMPDLIPGPIDDAVVMLIASGAKMSWLGDLLGLRRERRGGREAVR